MRVEGNGAWMLHLPGRWWSVSTPDQIMKNEKTMISRTIANGDDSPALGR